MSTANFRPGVGLTDATGGPAFPSDVLGTDELGEYSMTWQGMTLRDYFAAKAMQALLTKLGPYGEDLPKPYKDTVMHCKELAEYAFIQADDMLKARAS